MIKTERTWVLAWAAMQGFCLLMLHNWIDSMVIAGPYFYVMWPLYVVVLAFPLSMQMLSNFRERKLLWQLCLAYTILAAICASYAGTVAWVDGLPTYIYSGQIFLLGWVVFISWFILNPFTEHRLTQGTWSGDYAMLCSTTWRNLLKLLSAGLFVGIFWALLGLWAGLFKVLGIKFFEDLFTNRHFIYPVTAICFGIGLLLYSAREDALVNLYRATLNLLGWLLPLVSVIMLLFLMVVPVQGVSHLWKTGYATALMLSLLGLMVFLFNAAWQNGSDGLKLPAWLRILVNLALFSMPIFIALSAYAINLRVVQYGWTVERVWAAIIIGLTSLYAVGYAISVFLRSNGWMHYASKVNVFSAWLIALVLLMTQTPVLDPIRISVNSQVQRLLTKVTQIQSFDFEYLRFQGGYYGNKALSELVILKDHPQFSEINQKATQALAAKYKTYGANNHNEPENQADLVKLLHIYPSGSQVPTELLSYLWGETQSKSYWINCLRVSSGCQALLIDLNGDAENELVIFDGYNTVVFSQQDRQWKMAGHLRGKNWHQLEAAEIEIALNAGSVAVVDSKWRELKVLQDTYTLEPQ